MKMHFSLDPRLESDTKFITSLKICDLRLLDDNRWPWLVLIPRIANCVELHDLDSSVQSAVFLEIMQISQSLKLLYPDAKINIGALGNIVRQLHIHIIARHENDAHWPGAVWGVAGRTNYSEVDIVQFIAHIKQHLNS